MDPSSTKSPPRFRDKLAPLVVRFSIFGVVSDICGAVNVFGASGLVDGGLASPHSNDGWEARINAARMHHVVRTLHYFMVVETCRVSRAPGQIRGSVG